MGEKGKQKKQEQQVSEGGKATPPSNLPSTLQEVAGPLTTFDPEIGKGGGVPSVSQPGIVYQLRPFTGFSNLGEHAKGQSVSRPFLITSVDPTRQLCNGFVFIEPGDVTPTNGSSIGSVIVYVENIPHGGPGQPDTWHYISKGYTGKITPPPSQAQVEEFNNTQEV